MHTMWSVKGGVGVTVLAASLAAAMARRGPAVLVDLCGDAPAVLGIAEPDGPGLVDWLGSASSGEDSLHRLRVPVATDLELLPCGNDRSVRWSAERATRLAEILSGWRAEVVVDAGRIGGAPTRPDHDHLVAALASTGRSVLVTTACYLALRRSVRCELRPDGVVLVDEPGRSLGAADVADVVGVPVLASLVHDPALARAVDAGLLVRRSNRRVDAALGALW